MVGPTSKAPVGVSVFQSDKASAGPKTSRSMRSMGAPVWLPFDGDCARSSNRVRAHQGPSCLHLCDSCSTIQEASQVVPDQNAYNNLYTVMVYMAAHPVRVYISSLAATNGGGGLGWVVSVSVVECHSHKGVCVELSTATQLNNCEGAAYSFITCQASERARRRISVLLAVVIMLSAIVKEYPINRIAIITSINRHASLVG